MKINLLLLFNYELFSLFFLPTASCKFINCLNGKQCIESQKLMPECVKCPKCSRRQNRTTSHVDLKKIVCGTDGVSYRSLCELKSKSCRISKSIGLAYRGPCKGKNFFTAFLFVLLNNNEHNIVV